MTSEELNAIADEFAAAVTEDHPERYSRVSLATRELITALAHQASVQSSSIARPLTARQDNQQRQNQERDARADVAERRMDRDEERLDRLEAGG